MTMRKVEELLVARATSDGDGARLKRVFGGGDLNWHRIIPGTIRSVLNGECPVIRSDGRFVRDYIYAKDGAAGYMLLAEKLGENRGLIGEAYNFSNELQLTVREVVAMILRLMDSDLQPEVLNMANNEIPHQYLSATKAKEQLNWKQIGRAHV